MKRIVEVGPGARVVHLAGRVTDAVFSFLGPATTALAERGVSQTVVLVDDARNRRLLPNFHASVRLVLTRDSSPVQRMRDLLNSLCDEVSSEPTTAVHLHGFMPSLIAAYASRFRQLPATIIFSPHGSKSLGPMRGAGSALYWVLKPVTRHTTQRMIATAATDVRVLSSLTHEHVDLVESPIDPVFFEQVHREAPTPQVVTGDRSNNPRGAALFAQLAVLLGEGVLNLKFKWIGTADAESLARLNAAGVDVHDIHDDGARAAELASSWIYLAPEGSSGFPIFMAEAMAVGLPCVALDSPYHRDILHDRESGFLCRSEEEMAAAISSLVESRALRQRIGGHAKEQASARFDQTKFRDSILEVYADSMRAPL